MTAIRKIAGVDEAGRGPLAGPVYAAAVILDPSRPISGLDDSKKLSEKVRENLEKTIVERALSWCVASASVDEIDEINILQASMLAMQRAVEGLDCEPDLARVDGNRLPPLKCPAEAIVKGDSLHAEISAASILAKQERDREMKNLGLMFPDYGFENHKGYPTRNHIAALQQFGATRHHRKSFSPVKNLLGL